MPRAKEAERPVPVVRRQASRADPRAYARFFNGMLARGVLLPPSQFEAWFLSLAHGETAIEETIRAAAAALTEF